MIAIGEIRAAVYLTAQCGVNDLLAFLSIGCIYSGAFVR
jgi:hypothetical protein